MNKIRLLGLFTLAAAIFGCTPAQEQKPVQNMQELQQTEQQQPTLQQTQPLQKETINVERNIVDIENKKVKLETSVGDIVIELNGEKAPITVKNFLGYVDSGFYSGTIFHRVIKGFMIQGGGFTEDMIQKQTKSPIKNEASNSLKNDRGTIAMARTSIPDSATCQFFINTVDNSFLNYTNSSNPGYAVFGKVIEGMDVVDKIAKIPIDENDRPLEKAKIISAKVV